MILDTDFKIKFDGDQHQIDANVLINNLIHISTIIQEINRNLDTDKKIDIKINALEKGSFLVHIDLIETTFQSLKNLLTKENLETTGTIIGLLVGIIDLGVFLKGEFAKDKKQVGDKIQIKNKNGEIFYVENLVQNIYENNTIVRNSLNKTFEALEQDPSITAYEITDRNEKPLTIVPRKDFKSFSFDSSTIIESEKKFTVEATLNIKRISFDRKLKSDFYYKGNSISVKINDPEFYERVDKGESFSKGDTLIVQLEIKQLFDTSVNTYINKSYKIKKIIDHIKRDEQSSLDFQ